MVAVALCEGTCGNYNNLLRWKEDSYRGKAERETHTQKDRVEENKKERNSTLVDGEKRYLTLPTPEAPYGA